LGDARSLLLGVLDFLRTRRKAKGQYDPGNEVSPWHGTAPKLVVETHLARRAWSGSGYPVHIGPSVVQWHPPDRIEK